MAESEPEVSVVVATRDRPGRLAALLESLRRQTVDPGRFEVVVVDDASGGQATRELLAGGDHGELLLRVLTRAESGGPGAARNDGWRAARAPLVAFTDDDCVATAGWLDALLAQARSAPGQIVQGATEPDPAALRAASPFSHTLRTRGPGPWFETANIMYPRELLERLGGFDANAHTAVGEDTDLGWRAIYSGSGATFAPEAVVHHAVVELGPIRKLRSAARWSEAMQLFARYPELRRDHLWRGLFWRPSHYLLLRTLLALALPRALRPMRLFLIAHYLRFQVRRAIREERSSPLLVPYWIAYDAIELFGIVRGGLRYRTPVL